MSGFSRSEYDRVDKENGKLVFLFNREFDKEIEKFIYKVSKAQEFDSLANITTNAAQKKFYRKMSRDFDKPVFNSNYTQEAKSNAQKFLGTISMIESYARYGVMSDRVHNKLELKISFIDSAEADDISTGKSIYGKTGPNVLFKILVSQGRVTQVYSNGVELKNPPDWVINDIKTVVESTLSYDIARTPDNYFKAGKTKDEIKQDWERVGEK